VKNDRNPVKSTGFLHVDRIARPPHIDYDKRTRRGLWAARPQQCSKVSKHRAEA